MRICHDDSGQMMILTALFTMALFGLLALSTDVGLLFRAKRNLQIAADAAATAAALDYYYNGSVTSATSAATAAATSNGVTAGNGTTVTINCPPLSGPNVGDGLTCKGYFEAIVGQQNPTFFMKLFKFNSMTVSARAVAGTPGPSQGCVYVLDPTASMAMDLQGSFDVSVNHCGVIIDSNSSSALYFGGSSGSLTAASVSVVGGDSGQIADSNPTPVTGSAPSNDPINISGPVPPGGCTSTSSAVLLTGTVTGPGAGKSVCFTGLTPVTLANVTLGAGIYVFENGVITTGNVTSGTGGTTLDIYGGSLTVNTGTVLGLVAPTSGPTNGIALMEPASNKSTITIQKGNATGSLTGIIYAPSAQLYLQDSGGGLTGGLTLTTALIVDTLYDKTATLTIYSYNAANPSTTPLRAVALVE